MSKAHFIHLDTDISDKYGKRKFARVLESFTRQNVVIRRGQRSVTNDDYLCVKPYGTPVKGSRREKVVQMLSFYPYVSTRLRKPCWHHASIAPLSLLLFQSADACERKSRYRSQRDKLSIKVNAAVLARHHALAIYGLADEPNEALSSRIHDGRLSAAKWISEPSAIVAHDPLGN